LAFRTSNRVRVKTAREEMQMTQMTLAEEIAENIKLHVAALNVRNEPVIPFAVVAMTVDPKTYKPLVAPRPVWVRLPDGIEKGEADLRKLAIISRASVLAILTGASNAAGDDMIFLVVKTIEDPFHATVWTAPVEHNEQGQGFLGDWQKTVEPVGNVN
jgi:hypothetical protein